MTDKILALFILAYFWQAILTLLLLYIVKQNNFLRSEHEFITNCLGVDKTKKVETISEALKEEDNKAVVYNPNRSIKGQIRGDQDDFFSPN